MLCRKQTSCLCRKSNPDSSIYKPADNSLHRLHYTGSSPIDIICTALLWFIRRRNSNTCCKMNNRKILVLLNYLPNKVTDLYTQRPHFLFVLTIIRLTKGVYSWEIISLRLNFKSWTGIFIFKHDYGRQTNLMVMFKHSTVLKATMRLISKYKPHVTDSKIAAEDLNLFLYTCLLTVIHSLPSRC